MHPRFQGPVDAYRLPRPPAPSIQPGSFVVCPLALLQGLTLAQLLHQWSVYQIAFAEAQAVAQPSLLDRDLLAVWN